VPGDRAQPLGQFPCQVPRLTAAAVGPVRTGDQGARHSGHGEGASVQDGAAAQPQCCGDQAAGRRADQPAGPVAEAVQRVRRGQLASGDHARQQRALGRPEELRQRRLGEGHHDHDPYPVRRIDGEQRQQDQRLQDVGHHQHAAAVPAVDVDAGDGTQQQAGRKAGQHDAGNGSSRAGQSEHVDRQCDAQRPVAGDRDRRSRPEQAEVTLAQQKQVQRRAPVRLGGQRNATGRHVPTSSQRGVDVARLTSLSVALARRKVSRSHFTPVRPPPVAGHTARTARHFPGPGAARYARLAALARRDQAWKMRGDPQTERGSAAKAARLASAALT
jgi:hypothetical protein